MHNPTSVVVAERRHAIHKWLNGEFTFSHFVTLASNSDNYSTRQMHDRLRQWDARVNRDLYGPKWRAHYDELLWWFAFLEKPNTNPHWHLLLRFQDPSKTNMLPASADRRWRELVPPGSTDIQVIAKKPDYVNDYVLKRVGHEVEYEQFITPDEFRRN